MAGAWGCAGLALGSGGWSAVCGLLVALCPCVLVFFCACGCGLLLPLVRFGVGVGGVAAPELGVVPVLPGWVFLCRLYWGSNSASVWAVGGGAVVFLFALGCRQWYRGMCRLGVAVVVPWVLLVRCGV